MSADAPREQIIRYPPLLCIEVLSPEDRVSRMRQRIRDFIEMGVSQVWIFDPQSRTVMICDGEKTVEQWGGVLGLPGTRIALDLGEAFSALDL
jgi:Uma2 family endonuclease